MKRIHSFDPIVDRKSRILILGTMPGPQALRKREYYGFRFNHFWKIIAGLFGGAGEWSYAEKVRLLKQNHIALWDVLESCERVGAADSKMREMRPNDIPGLVARHPNIEAIFLNGGTAEKLFLKFFREVEEKLSITRLPSTSPAHASMPFEAKLKAWSAILPPSL